MKMVLAALALVMALSACPTESNDTYTPPPVPPDRSALIAQINEAETVKDGVRVAAQDEVSPGLPYVSQAVLEALDTALTAAKAVRDNESATQEAIDEARAALAGAVQSFSAGIRTDGTKTSGISAEELTALIGTANAAKSGVQVSVDGTDVPAGAKWVSQADMNALDQAITAAGVATDDDRDTLYAALNSAKAAFEAAKQDGTKVEEGNTGFSASMQYGTNTVVVSAPADSTSASVSVAGYVPTSALFSPTSEMLAALAGRNVVVSVENDGADGARPSPAYFSLSKAHEIYQALLAGAADPASITIDSATLAPLYKGKDWVKKDMGAATPVITIYENYPAETTLMPGIVVKKIGGLYVVEYDRNLAVEDVVYTKRVGGVVRGAGLYKKSGSSAVLVPSTGDWADVVIAGDESTYDGYTDNPPEYFAHLAEAGLMYSGGSTPSPSHKVTIMSDSDNNIFSNGVYAFIKSHKDGNIMGRLANTGISGDSYVDGSVYEGIAPRRNSDGSHNASFPGNVPVYMLNLIRSRTSQTTEFSNVNIIGDGADMDWTEELHFSNVSVVGDYHTGNLVGNFYGNLDIEGDSPYGIINQTSSPSGYLTVREAPVYTQVQGFSVLHVKLTADVKNIGAGNYALSNNKPVHAIVFEHKASINILGTGAGAPANSTVLTAYKAVRDPRDGVYKFTGAEADGFTSLHASDTTAPVPSIDPEAWRVAGNNKTNPATVSWSALAGDKKWTGADFANYNTLVSMLKGAGLRLAEAVVSRFSGRQMG
jgi:hypothetical protein